MKEKIILIGGGGHCKSCIDVIEQEGNYEIAGIIDLPEKIHQKVLGYQIIATDNDLPRLAKEYRNFHITIGQIVTPERRIALYNLICGMDIQLPRIISPYAYVSKHSKIGNGTIVMHRALINAGVVIGENCIINSSALVEHDVVIGNHCHISTSAVVNGGVKIGSGTFLGSNAICKESIEVAENVVIGCGAKILKNISRNSLAF